MPIEIKGAKEHNLKVEHLIINDGITVITGVSGSGKSSLAFNTIYHEANRQFHEAFGLSSKSKFNPALVDEINGLRPVIAIDQNVLNHNPNSTLASSSGLHPFFRILFSKFGTRYCQICKEEIQLFTKDEVLKYIHKINKSSDAIITVPIIKKQIGTFQTLLLFLQEHYAHDKVRIINEENSEHRDEPFNKISIFLDISIQKSEKIHELRKIINDIEQLGYQTIHINSENITWGNTCSNCNYWLSPIQPKIFHTPCPTCQGKGCTTCYFTGIHPLALSIYWQGMRIDQLLHSNVESLFNLFTSVQTKHISPRLKSEISKRLNAMISVGLEYLQLDRPMPTLSRGESQRVRLALALINNLDDMLYILDEPTIGLHIKNVLDILPEFRKLKGSTLFVEHDKIAAASADYAIDIGPGAGSNGGKIVFSGSIHELWNSSTITGMCFRKSTSERKDRTTVLSSEKLVLENIFLRNLKHLNLSIPLSKMTVITGVSGSGKTTLVRDVIVASLSEKKPVGCAKIDPIDFKAILVDQSPIGKNPRSNPATYTKLADLIRDAFAKKTNLPATYFSFNSKKGACSECNGLGSIEVKMTYLPSVWVSCEVCEGKKFNEFVLGEKISINNKSVNIADILEMSIETAHDFLLNNDFFDKNQKEQANKILKTLIDIGLGYLQLGQSSPTLSGGEAQRIKLTKFLVKSVLTKSIMVLDEPSTGLHPADITGLLKIFNSLLQQGATIIIIEHNPDIIREADWIIDLGPGSGDNGGELLYCGNYEGLMEAKQSITSEMLKKESNIKPSNNVKTAQPLPFIRPLVIKHAKVNNLKDISVEIPKNSLNIVTGVSGSGKSSLISEIIETEARRRFLESLSMYERQSTHEGAEIEAIVEGLGVTFSLQAKKERFYLRSTVGYTTYLSQQFAILFAGLGEQFCENCNIIMNNTKSHWECFRCGKEYNFFTPKHFSSRNYSSACLTCHGIGSKSIPNPKKLIINPEKPLCKGAMYSPGFFPKGYLCKEGNGGYYWLRALGQLYNFDPENTTWNEMTEDSKKVFLFGSDDILEYESFGLKGNSHIVKEKNKGFYGFIKDWDIGGTYTDRGQCQTCNGAGLRAQYNNIRITNKTYNEILHFPLVDNLNFIQSLEEKVKPSKVLQISLEKIKTKLTFLCKVGLNYLTLSRTMGTLSAGESQRIKLASLLGSNLQGLTIILDEPTRGMHPSEVQSLINVLQELKKRNNTLIVIEHDLDVIKSGDYIIELGPKAGLEGGRIVNMGNYEEFIKNESITSKWLNQKNQVNINKNFNEPKKFLKLFGARENNLKGDTLIIPLERLVGICGVSGSGKSTLIIDTLGRIIAPEKHTTSVAYEPIQPGKYDLIEGAPPKSIIIDQVKKGISNPLTFLELNDIIIKIYKNSDDFIQSELDENIFKEKCSRCSGEGIIKSEMGFLPPIYSLCDTCSGTGTIPELWKIKLHGLSIPELYSMTIDEISKVIIESELKTKLEMLQNLGLGYLILKQPVHSLSGGEIQRLKIAKELLKKTPKETLFILDEPSLGLHMADIENLMNLLLEMVKNKNTVIIIEHNAHILAQCDWLIELGPTGGELGGYIINTGTPLEFIKDETPTSKYIKEIVVKYD